MIATVNKSVYGTNRFQYVQPSPPPSRNGTGPNSSPTLDQSPLTLLVKACSNLDQLNSSNERKRLNPMSMAKMDSHFVPATKRPRMDFNQDSLQPIKQNVVLNGRLDTHNAPDSRYRINTSAHKTSDDKKNAHHASIYEPRLNHNHLNPFIQHIRFLEEPTALQSHQEPSVMNSHIQSNSCMSVCGNQACSCKINSPPHCAMPSPHNARLKNSYDWSYVASNAHITPYPMPMYSPFLVPPTPYTAPLLFGPLPSLSKPRLPFVENHGHCFNQNLPSNSVSYHPFPFISSYYMTPSSDQRDPICPAPSVTASTVSANFASSNNHSGIKIAKLSQYTYCAPSIEPNPTQITSLPKMTPVLTCPPPRSPLPPYSQPNWYMAAETSRLYYDYYYRIWLYNRAFNQLVNSSLSHHSSQEHYPYPDGFNNHSLPNWGEFRMLNPVPKNFSVDFPSAVAHKEAFYP